MMEFGQVDNEDEVKPISYVYVDQREENEFRREKEEFDMQYE